MNFRQLLTSALLLCSAALLCSAVALPPAPSEQTCTTSISGIVYAPNGTDPLPNVVVYVPKTSTDPLLAGVSCERDHSPVSGVPAVSAVTNASGSFVLNGAPAGSDIPLVIQIGKWRRQVVIPSVPACENTVASAALTRLPKDKTEGDIPKIAIVTGKIDPIECVLRKIGISDAEFTGPTGTGRVHLYQGTNGPGAKAAGTAGTEASLFSSATNLAAYDMILLACQGVAYTRTTEQKSRLRDYTSFGGRVLAMHFAYAWLHDFFPFSTTANWHVNQAFIPDRAVSIDQSFPRGLDLAAWLEQVGASTTPGQIPMSTLRHDLDGVVAPSKRWLYTTLNTAEVPLQYSFETPVGQSPDHQCGRIIFADHDLGSSTSTENVVFPNECASEPMTAKEKLMVFTLFDLANPFSPSETVIPPTAATPTPTPPTCEPTTCAKAGKNCGQISDNCGGTIDCGTCTSPQTCGGGGVFAVCGPTPTPTPTPQPSATATPTPEPTSSPTATPEPTNSPSPSPTAEPSATPSPSATATPTTTPTATPTPVPTTTPTTVGNIATRLGVETGDNVLIGGFIITGTQPKKLIVRAIGPSSGVAGALANPRLEMYDGDGILFASNDNWEDAPNRQEIIDSTIPPSHPLESAFLATLPPGNYTAVVSGVDDGTGIGVVEAYDLDRGGGSKLANIATRGVVKTGDNVMIGGLIILGEAAQKVIVRAIGPSLPVAGRLGDPTLDLVNGNGESIAFNNDWRETQQAEIEGTTIPPPHEREAAIVATLQPGPYTAVVRGNGDGTGIALVEVYALQ